MSELTHLDADGRPRMVDVTVKPVTTRSATAEAIVSLPPTLIEAIEAGDDVKGNVLRLSEVAGIMAAKQTAALIPLCHPLPIGSSEVSSTIDNKAGAIRIRATVRTTAQTGVEMEAMTAVSVAALTVYDMVKGRDKGVVIGPVRLLAKSGGRSGDWTCD